MGQKVCEDMSNPAAANYAKPGNASELGRQNTQIPPPLRRDLISFRNIVTPAPSTFAAMRDRLALFAFYFMANFTMRSERGYG